MHARTPFKFWAAACQPAGGRRIPDQQGTYATVGTRLLTPAASGRTPVRHAFVVPVHQFCNACGTGQRV